MGGLDTPTSGIIAWSVLDSRETLRPAKIAFVFQMPSLLASLSVVENVELPLLLGQEKAYLARKAAIEALERIGLSAIANKLPKKSPGDRHSGWR